MRYIGSHESVDDTEFRQYNDIEFWHTVAGRVGLRMDGPAAFHPSATRALARNTGAQFSDEVRHLLRILPMDGATEGERMGLGLLLGDGVASGADPDGPRGGTADGVEGGAE